MRKRSFEILLAAVLAVNLSACGMGEKEGQDLKIEEKGEESRTSEEEEEDLSETAEDREASASEEQSAQEGMKAAGSGNAPASFLAPMGWTDVSTLSLRFSPTPLTRPRSWRIQRLKWISRDTTLTGRCLRPPGQMGSGPELGI